MNAFKKLDSRKLAIIVIFSALGAVSSIAVGYGRRAPCHRSHSSWTCGRANVIWIACFWLALIAALVKNRGTATVGALTGIVEMLLPSPLGVFVFLLPLVEGAVIDVALLPFRKLTPTLIMLASGLSSSSNIVVLQAFQLLPSLPISMYSAMYGASFVSGLILGGYLSVKSLNALEPYMPA